MLLHHHFRNLLESKLLPCNHFTKSYNKHSSSSLFKAFNC